MKKINNTQLTNSLPIPASLIERRIYVIRGQKVMLDFHLAELYQVHTKVLNQTIKRNFNRFPEDFMFQLNKDELNLISQNAMSSMRSQIVTAYKRNIRYKPYAFTEHGIAMLSAVLKSERAVQMNILIIRAFIKMRQMLVANSHLEKRLDKVEDLQKLHHEVITVMAEDIKKIKNPPKTIAIGFEWKK